MKNQIFKFFREKERTMNFNVYVIHSAKPLADLKKALEECGGYTYAGIIYKSLHRGHDRGHVTEKEETKKTIVFCPEASITRLEAEYPTYKGKVANYDWQSFPMPSEQHSESWNLHISGVPNDYTVRDAETFVIDSLSCILSIKDESNTNFTVEFVPRLRETGEIHGYGHVNFSEHVDREIIKLCKLVLHNTPLSFKSNSKDKRMVACVWHRVNTNTHEMPKKVFEVRSQLTEKKYMKPNRQSEPVNKNNKSGKTMFRQTPENVRRSRPAPVRQVDVSNVVVETIVGTAKIETINKHGVVAAK